MQLEFLSSLKLPSLVKERLGKLPPNLQKVYDENYSQKLVSYQEEEREIVKNAFRFLLCAEKRLSTGGFLKALSVLDPENPPLSPNSLLDLCFNFLDVDTQLDVFRFAHLSVREYLESKSDYGWTGNHALAAECCVRLLSSDEVVKRGGSVRHIATDEIIDPTFWDPTSWEDSTFWKNTALRLTDFHEYACIHWSFHLARSGDLRLTSPLKDTSYTFMMDHQQATSDAYWVWSRDASWCCHHMSDSEYNGLRDELRWAISAHVAADYLFAACVWGFEDILQIRIRAALNPINGQVIHDSSRALALAANFGRLTAVRLLLEDGADPKWSSLGRISLTVSVIERSPDIFHFMFPNRRVDDEAETPLTWAVKNGDLEMTRMLLKRGFSYWLEMEPTQFARRRGISDEKPLLQQAIQAGRSDIAWLLLEYGANSNAGYNWWGSPVWFAAGKGDLKMLRMLFCWGAHAPTEFRESEGKRHQLSLVQKCLNADVVQLLQGRGCNFEHEPGLYDREEDSGSLYFRWMQFRQYPDDMHRFRRPFPW